MFLILIFGLALSASTADHLSKPLLQEILVPKNLAENRTTRLVCSIEQGESIDFSWFLNDRKLESNEKQRIVHNQESSELVIKSLSVDDLGDYRCLGKNKFGQDMQRISLVFNVKPKWFKEPQDLSSSLNKEVTLECDVISYPFPVVKWFKLDKNGQKVTKDFKPSKTIKFNLTKETTGIYKCLGQNSVGFVEKIVHVRYYG